MELALINACWQRWGLSPMDIVQAAWAATVRIYSGSDDVMFVGVGTERPSLKEKWINTSLCRARLEMDGFLMSALERTRNGGLLEADSKISVPEALEIFSTLDPKPCNSAIMLRDPLVKAKLSGSEIVGEKSVSSFLVRDFGFIEWFKLIVRDIVRICAPDRPLVCIDVSFLPQAYSLASPGSICREHIFRYLAEHLSGAQPEGQRYLPAQ